MSPPSRAPLAAVAGLLFNAMVWGLSWWPMRQLQAAGVHPLWATALIFGVAVVVIGVSRPSAWRQVATQPALWLILLAAGGTNAAFNWGVTVGDVVRVVLLFYVMPLWAVLLARWLLKEPLTGPALLRVALAMGGALCVLWPANGWDGSQTFQPADMLGLLGGFTFALNNVMLRREVGRTEASARGLAMFLGGALVGLALVALVDVPPLPPAAPGWLGLGLGLAGCFLLSNLALQHSATRLPAHITAVVMLTEVPWAAGSAWLLGAGQLTPMLLLGGALIGAAALLAAVRG